MTKLHIPHPWIAQRAKLGPALTKPDGLGFNGRLAVFATEKFGSMAAFYVLVVWMFGWMLLASIGVAGFRNDPYPFNFLLFLSNLVQLFALPILAVGQQVLSRASNKQAELTFRDAEAILKLQDEVRHLIEVNNEMTTEIHRAIQAVKPSTAG